MEKKRTYGVWAVRSSTSIFGPAQSWCKENGKPLEFDTKAAAENYAKLAAVPTSRQSRYWDFIKDYADEQYAESCKEWSAFAEHKCAGLSVANKKYLADIFEKASLLELAFWKMAYRNERMEENAK